MTPLLADREMHNAACEAVIGAAIEVHRTLGPGLLESAYTACLDHELSLRKVQFQREIPIHVSYKGRLLEHGYRADFLIDDLVVVEVKSADCIADIHRAQLLTYLRLMDRRLGLIINFNVQALYRGIRRVVNGL
ncbi:MAG: GxxExxY protein [Gemmatimonadales bacterium]